MSEAVRIGAVVVNHNTSAYTELMARSLFAQDLSGLNLSLTIYDNGSQDDLSGLSAYVDQIGIPIIQSGFTTATRNNSHGEVLSRFALDNPDCSHYLFLDTDVCFIEPDTLTTMLDELSQSSNTFGIGARMSWDGEDEIPQEILAGNADLYRARLHPCCALVKNTPLFRAIVTEIGLSCANMLWADRDEYLDTFKLMTKVMKTHGQKHIISSKMVLHFFSVSYVWEPTEHLQEAKAARRDELLLRFV